jgi:hypothetical protein
MLLWPVARAFAMTMSDTESICPLDGLKFTQSLPMSGTAFGMMLDFRQTGAIASPWPQAECPKDGLVLYKEFTSEEVRILAAYVPSAEYQALRQRQAQYWRIAHLQKALGAPPAERAPTLLKATWEARPRQYEEYAEACLEAYQDLAAAQHDTPEALVTSCLVIGELRRRLKRFDAAKSVFTELENNDACRKAETCRAIVRQQLRLIERQESGNEEFKKR